MCPIVIDFQSKIDTLPQEDLPAFLQKQMSKQLKMKMDSVNKEKQSVQSELAESISLQKRQEEEIECLKQKSATLEETLRGSSSNKQSEQMEFEYEGLKLKFEERNKKMDKFRDMFAHSRTKIRPVQRRKEKQLHAELQIFEKFSELRSELN